MFVCVELIYRIGSLNMKKFFKRKLSQESATGSSGKAREGASNSPQEPFYSTSVRKKNC